MGLYSYQARDLRGELINGTIDASCLIEASRKLRMEGKYVINLTEGLHRNDRTHLDELRIAESARRVKRDEVIDFCHQLAVMLDTGVPLGRALECFNQNQGSSDFKRIIEMVTDEVTSGATLSSALGRWPQVFPTIMISLVEASEASGTMGMMLSRVSEYLSKELKTFKQIRGAMTYPTIMMILAVVISIFLMVVVLPRFASIYANREAMLPTPTKILLAVSGVLTQFWPHLIAGVLGVVVITIGFLRKPVGRRTVDWLKLRAPMLGHMYGKLYLARSARTLATLLVSGVDLLEAIRITQGVANNSFYTRMWAEVTEQLESGRKLCDALSAHRLIPGNIIQMISAGEQAGRIGKVMERIGEVTESELDDAVAKTTQYIEPIMIGFMGVLIGTVAISLLLPIFTISNVIH
ncbi:MAG: type II secretion system F family protein [Planctomycetes bacterium]|nr:type II secretion system F family protein [Planctomycetota bacterium]